VGYLVKAMKAPYKSSTYFKRSLHGFYRVLLLPRGKTEDDRRQEFILNCILIGSIVLLGWSDLYLLILQILGRQTGVPFVLFSSIVIIFAGLYFFSRRGYFIGVSHILIWLYFSSISYAAYRWGPSLPAALLSYSLLIVISSILVSTQFSIALTGIVVVVISILGYAESSHINLPDSSWKLAPFIMGDAVEYSIILGVIALVSWLANREMERSLKRARGSEKALIEERNLLETRVVERTKELQHLQSEKVAQLYRFAEFGRLSSGLFHDLMTPLSSVYLNLSQVTDSADPELPITKLHLEKAVAASRKMENFIINIRKQVQIQETSAFFRPEDEIKSVIDLLRYKALKQHVDIAAELEEGAMLYGNPIKFNQIAMNLLSNAIDSYDGMTESGAEKVIKMRLTHDRSSLRMSVEDNGCGIPAKIVSSIFDQFFTTKSQYKGTGIGLSSTKNIVEKDFFGTIAVKSEEGKGSLFDIYIPLISDDPKRQKTENEKDPPEMHR
jgi:signal transduction histidine kinase